MSIDVDTRGRSAWHPLERRLHRALSTLVPRGHRLLLAVSGGRDSMALMHATARVAQSLHLRVSVATVDHGLRPDSAGDAAFVCSQAAQLGLVCTQVQVRLPADATEAQARLARYAVLADLAAAAGAHHVATAHHLQDQAETVLMRALTGVSPAALRGIRRRRRLHRGSPAWLVRPLLDAPAREIAAYMSAREIGWREDASNLSPRHLRNRVRASLVPRLDADFPRWREHLAGLAELLREDERALQASVRRALAPEDGPASAERLARLPPALARRAVRAACAEVPELAAEHVRAAVRLLRSERPSWSLDLPGGWRLVRDGADFGARRGGAREAPGPRALGPGRHAFGEWVLTVHEEHGVFDPADLDPRSLAFAPGALAVRAPRRGDRFEPLGLGGSRRVSRALLDAKVPRAHRVAWPLLEADDTVLAVVGIARSRHRLVAPGAARWIRVSAERAHGQRTP